jgi:cytidylate kinase
MCAWRYDVIAISGMPGSGTTTAAKLVSAATGFTYRNTGQIFRAMAEERGMTLNEFGQLAAGNPEIDRELDRRQVEIGRAGNVLLEGRLSGHMLKKAGVPCLAVWLEAPLEVRMQRVSSRDSLGLELAMQLSAERERGERERYLAFYGFDLLDTSLYDLVLDSSRYNPEQICISILAGLRS